MVPGLGSLRELSLNLNYTVADVDLEGKMIEPCDSSLLTIRVPARMAGSVWVRIRSWPTTCAP